MLVCVCQLLCTPTTVLGQSTAPTVDYMLPSFVSMYTLTELHSATRYSCLLRASTQKGFGPSASLVVWTEPDGMCFTIIIVNDDYWFRLCLDV